MLHRDLEIEKNISGMKSWERWSFNSPTYLQYRLTLDIGDYRLKYGIKKAEPFLTLPHSLTIE